MSQHKLIITLFLLTTAYFSSAQNLTLSGYVRDKTTGETLIGASIYEKQDPSVGTATNNYGFFSLTLKAGKHTLIASFVGYNDIEKKVELTQNETLNIELGEGIDMQEVVIKSTIEDKNVQSTQMGVAELPLEMVKKLPSLGGEVDILKSLQLLPGVMSAGEGNAGFYVRGGGPDQNLVLLDEATVYNTGHLLGFFSVFNSDAIKNTKLLKGNMPAQYGGRLSSVVDVQMRDGNMKGWALQGGIGLIASRLTVEAPIVKDKASFLVSGRRTYAFDIAQPFLKGGAAEGTNYNFYDLNTKLNVELGQKDRIFGSGYFGRDVLNYTQKQRDFNLNLDWGNSTATLRWNHVFNNKLFMNVTTLYNDYKFEVGVAQKTAGFDFNLFSGVRDWSGKVAFGWFLNNKHQIDFGADYIFHTFIPNKSKITTLDNQYTIAPENKYGHEAALYIQDDWKISRKLAVNIGTRFSGFRQVGPYVSNVTGQAFESGEEVKTYTGIEPRLGLRYIVGENASIKGGVSVNKQYIHLVANSNSTFPSDLWVPSTDRTKPQNSIQYAIGYFQNLHKNEYETSVELYYKDLDNQIEFGESFVRQLKQDRELQFVYGAGRAYGAEFFIKKRTGKLNGWLGYTLSRTERSMPDIEKGRWFPTKYDRTHDISLALNYELDKEWDFGLVFIYGTGNAFTRIESFYLVNGELKQNYGLRNEARAPAYHRADVSVNYTPKKWQRKNYESSFNFSIYNVYDNWNQFATYYDAEVDQKTGSFNIKNYQITLFPIIPSITWNFKWKQR